jgi:hypothetical protein
MPRYAGFLAERIQLAVMPAKFLHRRIFQKKSELLFKFVYRLAQVIVGGHQSVPGK